MAIIRWILVTIVVVAVVGFALQNQNQMVHVKLGTYSSPEAPLFLALFIAFLIGMVLYFILTIATQLKLRGELSRFRRECNRLKEELNRLRNLHLDKEVDSLLRNRPPLTMTPIAESKHVRQEDETEGWGA
jgi:uncharacterized integral membrane protein